MKKLNEAQAGDLVILTKANGQREIREVRANRLHPDDFIDVSRSNSAYHFRIDGTALSKFSDEWIAVATPKLLEQVRYEIHERESAAQAEAERIKNDPKTPYISRFRAGDFEPWDKLSLNQLELIADWLDKAEMNLLLLEYSHPGDSYLVGVFTSPATIEEYLQTEVKRLQRIRPGVLYQSIKDVSVYIEPSNNGGRATILYTATYNPKLAKHNIHLRKPREEYLNYEWRTITLNQPLPR